MHGDRRRRLEVGARDRGVDEHADAIARHAGFVERLLAGEGSGTFESDVFGPPATLTHTRDVLQHARTQAQALVHRSESLVDLGGGDHDGRIDRGDRHHRGVGEAIQGIAAHNCPIGQGRSAGPRHPSVSRHGHRG